jgi:uncharacterized protein with WD repeat
MNEYVLKIDTLSRSGLKSFNGPILNVETYEYHTDEVKRYESISNLKQPPIFSMDGKLVAFIRTNQSTIEIFDAESELSVISISCDAQNIEFSPLGRYLITWSRPGKSSGDEMADPNLHIWSIADGSIAISFYQKVAKKDVIQWTSDEMFMFYKVTNEVHIYNGINLSAGIINRVVHKGFSVFKSSITSNPSNYLIMYF